MTTSQVSAQRPQPSDNLTSATYRGKLIPGQRDGFIELDTSAQRFELLGPLDTATPMGVDVEIVGVPVPRTRNTQDLMPALLVRHVRAL
jgi:hypothetical protein